jgi:hypothetical protein
VGKREGCEGKRASLMFDGKKDSLEGMEVRKGRLTYNGFFPKILMKASSTLQNSSCNSSYDSVVRSLWDQV